MAGSISGVFNTTALGPAIASIGNDFSAYARQGERQDWGTQMQLMRQEYALKLKEMALEAKAAGAGGSGNNWAKPADEVTEAARVGMTVPEYRETMKAQTEGYGKQRVSIGGPGESEGEYTEGLSYDQGQAQREGVKRLQGGLVKAAHGPKEQKSYQESLTEETVREGAFSGNPDRVERTRQGVMAKEGKDRYGVDGDEKIDQFKGPQGQTEQGKAKTSEHKAKAAEASAKAKNESAGGGTSNRVQSVQKMDDGSLRIVYNSGKTEPLKDETGNPIKGESMVKARASVMQRLMQESEYKYGDPATRDTELKAKLDEIFGSSGSSSSASGGGGQNPARKLSSLPAGAKKVGTSKGKDVYETPDGKRFIAE